jgi:hypothetical protein
MVVVCYHFSSLVFVISMSRVVFVKYIALKTYLVFSANCYKTHPILPSLSWSF